MQYNRRTWDGACQWCERSAEFQAGTYRACKLHKREARAEQIQYPTVERRSVKLTML